MRFLSEINSPADLRQLKIEDLQEVADEVRAFMLETCSRVGGHTGASLGAVELAVAMHYVFDTPADKLVWDVGHQAYAHKILTGRRDKLHTIKQYGGLSGFLRREESEYDTFGAGHASTSLSAALASPAASTSECERCPEFSPAAQFVRQENAATSSPSAVATSSAVARARASGLLTTAVAPEPASRAAAATA